MTTYTDEISIYNTDAIQGGIDDAHDAYKSVIAEVGSTGVKVHPSGQSGSGIVDYTLIDANGTHVYKGGNEVAAFGDTARIGKASGASRMELDSSSLKMVDRNDIVFFKVEDMRGDDGVADIAETFQCNEWTFSSDMIINTGYLPNSANYSVSVLDMNGDDVTGEYTITIHQEYPNNLFVSPYPPNGHTVVVEYSTESPGAVAYTLGQRFFGSLLGGRSVAEGAYVIASGYSSHAEGSNTEAAGSLSHAEGFQTKALGWSSHAQNFETIAASDHQTAIGKYNVEDALGVYAVIVGNGDSDQYRSNALAIDWHGNVLIAGDVKNMSGTKLYADASHSHSASDISSGTLSADRIPSLAASKIGSGTFDTARIPSLDASKIGSGTFAADRIPSLAASKIGSGTFATDRIPSLAASKISSGTFDAARIPSLDASKIGSGTLPIGRGGTGTTNFGTVTNVDKADAVSTPSGTSKQLASVSCAAGKWLLIGSVWFASNATGRRAAQITATSASVSAGMGAEIVPAVNGTNTCMMVSRIFQPSSTTTYYLNALQNSGSTLNAAAYLTAIKLG